MTATVSTGVREEQASRWQRVRGPALVIGGLAVAAVALHVRDPHQQGTWGVCPTNALFGFYCPGCGGLRAVNDLTDGHLVAAASSNLALVVALPFLVLGLGLWTLGRWQGRSYALPRSVSRPLAWVTLALLLGFMLVRNLPGSWLAP